MEKSYQLVAWTDKGRVRMLPSEVNTFLHEELDKINRLSDRIRYNTCHEVHDLLEWSCAYEKLALQLLDLGQVEDAFRQLSQAARRRPCAAPLLGITGRTPNGAMCCASPSEAGSSRCSAPARTWCASIRCSNMSGKTAACRRLVTTSPTHTGALNLSAMVIPVKSGKPGTTTGPCSSARMKFIAAGVLSS